MIAYYNGEYVPDEAVHFSPNDRGLMFADGVYEVVRSYGGLLFRLEDHLVRLRRSLEAVRIRCRRLEEIPAICRNLITRNGLEQRDALVYLQVTRGIYKRTHSFPPAGLPATVFAQISELHVPDNESEEGIAVILVGDTRWSRCDIKSLALLPNVLAAEEASERGAREALFVRDGMVIEGSRSNYAGVRSGVLVTPPESNYMLSGVSRGVVIELCAKLGIPVEQRPIPERELFELDELALIGTSAEVLPITSVNGRPIAGGLPGPITRSLKAAFRAEVEAASRANV